MIAGPLLIDAFNLQNDIHMYVEAICHRKLANKSVSQCSDGDDVIDLLLYGGKSG